MRLLAGLLRGILWIAAVVLIGLGTTGVSQAVNPVPGESSRPELYARTERIIAPGLASLTTELDALDVPVEALADAARAALVDLTNRDPESLEQHLAAGDVLIFQIQTRKELVQATLAGLPYDASSDLLGATSRGRLAAAVDALEAVAPLPELWSRLSASTGPTKDLTAALTAHDQHTYDAIGQGAGGHYTAALKDLTAASGSLDEAQAIRDKVVEFVDTSTIDQWIQRNRAYDEALSGLYKDLRASGGAATAALRRELAAVEKARQLLPPDTRALIVIVGDLAQGGLNDAAISIELARGALADAVAAVH